MIIIIIIIIIYIYIYIYIYILSRSKGSKPYAGFRLVAHLSLLYGPQQQRN